MHSMFPLHAWQRSTSDAVQQCSWQCASVSVDHAVHALLTACSGGVHVLHDVQNCPKVHSNMRCVCES